MALSYKVLPGTPYYSNTTLTTKAGEIVNTTDATYVNTTYGTVSVGGSTYYVAYGMMVSFWNSSFTGQQIDDSVTKVRAASATPASGGTGLFTTGGAYALQTAAAAKADLTSIIQTGTTCTEANGIAAGVYFYLNGDLVCAKTAIANGATFTLNTNYETPTAGALNALKSALDNVNSNIGIVENGDNATHAIYGGRYVIWKGSVYAADYNIAVGTILADSGGGKNLTAVDSGSVNSLYNRVYNLIKTYDGWTSEVDLNNYKDTGFFVLSSRLTNSPSTDGAWGLLFVIAPRPDSIKQFWLTANVWYRNYNNGWSSWVKLN